MQDLLTVAHQAEAVITFLTVMNVAVAFITYGFLRRVLDRVDELSFRAKLAKNTAPIEEDWDN